MAKRIIVSGYFAGDGQAAKLQYFERLDEALQPMGYRLHLLDLSPADPDTRLPYDRVPYFVMAGHKVDGSRYLTEPDVADEVKTAASIEAANRNGPLLNSCVKTIFFRAYFREVLRRTRPSLCILWHQLNALHRAAQGVCEEIGLPCALTEYGVLPGTIGFETGGQMGESRVAQDPEWFLNLPVDDADLERADAYIEFVRNEKRTRKDQSSEFDLEACVAKARERGRAVIFYAGQQDYASGLLPRSLPESHVHSPHFADTLDALRHLSELAERNDWHIIFKPHPILAERSKNYETPYPNRVDVALGANIFDCMALADVTTTIVSQVSYMALVHERPCVLLGRTQLTGKGCVYEPVSFGDIETTFARAIDQGFTSEQQNAWRRHVAQVMRHYAYRFDEDLAQMPGRGVEAVAQYLAETAAPESIQMPKTLWENDARGTGFRRLQRAYRAMRVGEPLLRSAAAFWPGDLKAKLKQRYR